MIVKEKTLKSNYFFIKVLFILIFIIVGISILIPFKYYRLFTIAIISKIEIFNDINEHSIKQNKFYRVSKGFEAPFEIIINYLKSNFMYRDSININMAIKDYQKLNHRIFLAKKRGKINREDKNVEVNANILFDNNNYKSKIRLKGYYLDHAIDNKWSFRVKLNNNQTIKGMNRFSLHNPLTRNYAKELVYHKILKGLDLMYLEYTFVDLYINGKEIGIYAIEEFMHDNLIEKNKRRDGILLRRHDFLFNEKKVKKNKERLKIFNEYGNFYSNLYLNNLIKISDYYDLDRLAKYFAITQIFSGGHGHYLSNFITYYNPLTKKIEVIGYDTDSGILDEKKLQIETGAVYYFKNSHIKKIYKDKNFLKKYIYYLIKYSKEGIIDKILKNINEQLKHEIRFLAKIKPWKTTKSIQDYISNNRNYVLKYFSKYVLDYSNITDLEIKNFMEAHSISPFSYNNIDYTNNEFINQNGNLLDVPFVNYNHYQKIARIKRGTYTLRKNLIIPKGITFIIDPGTTIILDNSSSIVSYSNMQLKGNKSNFIKFIAKSNNNSLCILYAKRVSNFNYVVFKNLSNHSLNNFITGSLSFYESDITINNSLFLNNSMLDDHLNIIRSNFKLFNTKFVNSYADSIDIDFSNGIIDNLTINGSKNDGIDFSNSTVSGKNIFISNSDDKGISIGENSDISFSEIKITNSKMGIAIKDSSNFNGNNIHLNQVDYGIALYNKKPMYGFSNSSIFNINYIDVENKALLENGSVLYIDGKRNNSYSNTKQIQNL